MKGSAALGLTEYVTRHAVLMRIRMFRRCQKTMQY